MRHAGSLGTLSFAIHEAERSLTNPLIPSSEMRVAMVWTLSQKPQILVALRNAGRDAVISVHGPEVSPFRLPRPADRRENSRAIGA
jgi:hypothetical protein